MTPSRAARFKVQRRMLCSARPRKWEFIVRSWGKRDKGQAAPRTGCSRSGERVAAFVTHRNSGAPPSCVLNWLLSWLSCLVFVSQLYLLHISLSLQYACMYFPQRSSMSPLPDPVVSATDPPGGWMSSPSSHAIPPKRLLANFRSWLRFVPNQLWAVLQLCVTYA